MQEIRRLLNQMTIEEKVAQLGSVAVDDLIENGEFSKEKAEKLLKNGIGEITRVVGSGLYITPRQAGKIINEIQRFLLENTRTKIPAIVHEECLAGLMGPTATIFPIPLALASTWEPELIKKMAELIRKQALTIGIKQCLSPVLDLCRDPRWGRCEETYGEDPFLVSKMGEAYIMGLQGNNELIATAKHFVAHGSPEGGRNTAPVSVGTRELRNVYLYPFEVAVKRANVLAIMPAYHEIDGIPLHANHKLLTKVLRQEWGFNGLVVSDYMGIKMLNTVYKIAENCKEASVLSLTSGVTIEFPSLECFSELVEAVKSGEIPITFIDKAVERVLYVKQLVGLFDNPYVNVEKIPERLDDTESRRLARELALRSIILLKNQNNILPLSKQLKIAVVGPLADDPMGLLGDYHYPTHLRKFKSDIEIVSILDGIKRKAQNVTYAKGSELTTTNEKLLNEAVDVVKSAEVVIAVVGDMSCIFDIEKCTSGEGIDRADLNLPEAQLRLIDILSSLGKLIVLVVIAGRPMSLTPIIDKVSAVIWVWKPGEEGGNAVADVLFGDASPSGRLPVSLPRSVGQLPIYYYRKPSSLGKYIESSSEPLFPFGFGLTYSTVSYTNFKVLTPEVPINGEIKVSVELENQGKYEIDEVVQVYISREKSSIVMPTKELKSFKRVNLKPGEKKEVEITIPTEALALYNRDLKLVIEPGNYKVLLGKSSSEILYEGTVKISGRQTEIIRD